MNVSTYLINVFALIYLAVFLQNSTMLKNQRKRPFAIAIAFAIAAILAEMGTVASAGRPELSGLHTVLKMAVFALSPMITLTLIAIFDTQALSKHKWMLLPSAINLFFAVMSPLNGMLFQVDAFSQYARGASYPIFVTVYVINALLLMFYTLYIAQRSRFPIKGKMTVLLVFSIAFRFIRLLYPSHPSAWHGVTISLILFYLLMADFDCSFDGLSGLYSRITFDRVAKQLTEKGSMSLIILDINDFKAINDTYGHFFGDTVIQEVAVAIRESFDQSCTCCRIGGDEFAVICKTTDKDAIERQLAAMNRSLAQKRKQDSRMPTVAYGYSVFDKEGAQDFEQSFHEADAKMYECKKTHQDSKKDEAQDSEKNEAGGDRP